MQTKHFFPLFNNHPRLVYLDNAATTQKPQVMIDSMMGFYQNRNANVHRGLYSLSEEATLAYEKARATIASFVGAQTQEIIFTGGTTDSMNKLSIALAKPEVQQVLISGEQHHSAILPWRTEHYRHDYIRIDSSFEIDYSDLQNSLTSKRYDILVLTHISNVTGAVLDFGRLTSILRELPYQPIVILDAAQSLAHTHIDVTKLPIDFLVGSAHKVYGPTGLGLIWGKTNQLAKLSPMHVGGGMIRSVELESTQWANGIEKFEAGTPPIAEAVAWASAIEWLQTLELSEVYAHEKQLTLKAVELMKSVPGIKLYLPPQHLAVISFNIANLHPHDIAQLLGDPEFGTGGLQIALRAGHHCAQIMHQQILKVPATARLSLAMYNDYNDVEQLVAKLAEIIQFLPK